MGHLSRSTRRVRLAVVAVVLSSAAAACGSDAATPTTAAPAAGGSTAPQDTTPTAASGIEAEAARIAELATAGLVFAPADSGTKSTDIVAQTGWLGPTSTPKPAAKALVEIIICAPGTACEVAGNYVAEAAKLLGWDTEIVAGAGSPDSFITAFDSAMAKKPQAIIGLAIPDVAVQAKLAEARKAGIITVSVADVPAASGGGEAYDAYVSYRMPLMHQVSAYAAINESKGAANTILINDSEFPNLVESNKQYTRVMADCSGCKVTQVEWLIADALDPVKTDAIIGAALAANPDANYLVLPYSIGLPSVVDAVRKAGKSDKIKIVAKDGDSVGLSAIASGGSSMNAGVSLQWVAYAGVDQIIRGLAKEPYLKAEELGLGVHLFTKADSPADGNADYTKFLDYVSEYKKLWGLS